MTLAAASCICGWEFGPAEEAVVVAVADAHAGVCPGTGSPQTEHDKALVPPVEPGEGWTCENGCRHFVCYRCHHVFTSKGKSLEVDARATDEDTFSLCDTCSAWFLDKLRAEGVIK